VQSIVSSAAVEAVMAVGAEIEIVADTVVVVD
jgi:hypothetical protein